MAFVFDYLDKIGDFSIEESPLSEVDFSVFSHLSTPNLTGIVPSDCSSVSIRDACLSYLDSGRLMSLGKLQPGQLNIFLQKISSCQRFSNLGLCYEKTIISDSKTEQFGAVTIKLPDGAACISFRGTDDTIIGWKENCHLAVYDVIPAQQTAVDYLNQVAKTFEGKIYVLGHSKGGNLAVYASCNSAKDVRDRIVDVHNFDGPGFKNHFFGNENYKEMKDRITTVLTQNSMVGVLMKSPGNIVYATSSANGPFAHDSLKWYVNEDCFVRSQGLSKASERFERIINSTIDSIDSQSFECFIEDFFSILMSKGASTITDLSNMGAVDFIKILLEMNGDQKVKNFNRVLIKSITKEYLSFF